MAHKLPPVDIAIVGMGWAGGIMAKELAATGLKVVGFERGGTRATYPDFAEPMKSDEIRYARRNELMQDTARETVTFRNRTSETALPMRRLGSFLPGEGVGGSGLHWGASTYRFTEWDFQAHRHTVARHGAKVIPQDMQLQDWGLTYADLEPHYEKFEVACGTSGKAGNLNGVKVAGGNIFEEPRRSDYPNPPLPGTHSMELFDRAARQLGYHPHPAPSSIASRNHVTPDGVQYGQCHCCGYCGRYGCQADAKASPHITLLPLAMRSPNFELRTQARVLRVNLDSTGAKAIGVTYLDATGREVMQPAELVILSAYALANVHLMLLSGIGSPYDPAGGHGVVGRNYSYQALASAVGFFDEQTIFNPFMGSGGLASAIDDYHPANCDFGQLGFIGGAWIAAGSGGAEPIGRHPVPQGTPRWGADWKKAVVRYYNHSAGVMASCSVMSYRQNFLDLDPTYKDAYGRPLLRMTFDFAPNEVRMMRHFADITARITAAMGAQQVDSGTSPVPYSIVPYQSTHNVGGAVMGANPQISALNNYSQSWDVPNVFVVGGNAFPQNSSKPPTATIGALAFRAAEGIKKHYLKSPGPLVQA